MTFALPETARDPRVRSLYRYWVSKCRPGRLPGRADIDPLEMLPFLADVIMFDVERKDEKYRFRYRLVGTQVVELFGRDATGQYLDQVNAEEYLPASTERLTSVVTTRQPVYALVEMAWRGQNPVFFESLTVPLAADGEKVDVLLGVRCSVTAVEIPRRFIAPVRALT